MKKSLSIILVILGTTLIIIILLAVFGILRVDAGHTSASGNNPTVCTTQQFIFSVGNFKLPIGKPIVVGCAE